MALERLSGPPDFGQLVDVDLAVDGVRARCPTVCVFVFWLVSAQLRRNLKRGQGCVADECLALLAEMATPHLDWLPMEAKSSVEVMSSCANIASFLSGMDYFELGRFGSRGSVVGTSVWCVLFCGAAGRALAYTWLGCCVLAGVRPVAAAVVTS